LLLLLFAVSIKAIVVSIGFVVWRSFVERAILIIGAVVRRVIGFETVAKVTLVLSAVFTNVSGVVTFVTIDTRGFGREVWGRNELCTYSGKLMVPVWTVNGWGLSRADGNFNPRRGCG